MDQFSEFVRGFNPSLDQDLMLAGVQAAQLAQRRLRLANSEQTIAAYPQKIAAVEGLNKLWRSACHLARPIKPAWTGCWVRRSSKDGYRMSRLSWTPTRLPFTR